MADNEKLVAESGLQAAITGSEQRFVLKQTGKGLSTNDFTDELKAKLERAGESDFSGDYNDLTNKPAVDGQEIDSSSTAWGLGLAKTTDLPTVASGTKPGLVYVDGLTITVDGTGKIVAKQQDLSSYAKKTDLSGLASTSDVSSAVNNAKSDLESTISTSIGTAKTEIGKDVDSKISASEKKLSDEIAKQISSHGTYRGQVASISELPTSGVVLGDEYNITKEFTTTADKFTDGGNKTYPPGANVVCSDATAGKVKWDVTQGFTDFSVFPTKTDIYDNLVTAAEVNAMWSTSV